MLGVVLSMGLVSCDIVVAEDDPVPSTPVSPTSPASSTSGLSSRLQDVDGHVLFLTKIDDYEYNYASNGTLVSCGLLSYTDSHDHFQLDGLNYKGGVYGTDIDGSVELNSDGLVAKGYCTIKESYNESGIIEWTCSWEFTCTYNAEKQLQKIEATERQESFDANGQSAQSGEEKAVLTYTWTDDNLVKVVLASEESGYVSDHFFRPRTYTFSYGNEENVTRQPVSCQDMLDDRGFMNLNVLGLYGVGPKNFPKSYTEERIEEGKLTVRTEDVQFTLNENGSIHTENSAIYQYGELK